MPNAALGFAASAVSVLFFGSNFVPVKSYETGDGVFFQWIQCSAIFILGMIVNSFRGFPPIQPIAMLGGVVWCSGNIMVVPIVKMIGLSLGILVWGTANLISGWSSGNFGLFGLTRETVANPALNYIGVSFAVLSVIIMVGIRTTVSSKVEQTVPASFRSLNEPVAVEVEDTFIDRMSPGQRRVVGISLSILSGILYGVNFDPPTYVMNHDHSLSQNGLDYVFSHFSGIYLTSTFFFLVYCVFKRNQPVLYASAVLPGFMCGALWAVAQISWFFANSQLPLVVSFPIISTGPGMVASLWGIFVFGEISGRRNYLILAAAFACTISAAALTSLSTISR